MAYNNYYPQYYPQMQNYQNPNYQMMQQQMPTQQSTIQQSTQAQTGLIGIPSEADARNYPVAYGNSVTFKDENGPYIYTKTMGFSQLEPPKFEKYRLIKEEESDTKVEEVKKDYVERPEMKADMTELKTSLKTELDNLKAEIKTVKADVTKLLAAKKKREVVIDDDDE